MGFHGPSEPQGLSGQIQSLRAALQRVELAELVPPTIWTTMLECAAVDLDAPPRITIVGERGRGRRALANRLARASVVSTGPKLPEGTVVIPPRVTEPDDRSAQAAELIIPPPLGERAEDTAAATLPAILGAAGIVCCVSAAQLLSAAERDLITAVLQSAGVPGAIAVGRMEVIEDPEDGAEVRLRAQRFADALGSGTVPVFFLPPATGADPAPPADDLERWIALRLADDQVQRRGRLRARMERLLAAVEAVLPRDLEPVELPALDELLALLDAGHRRALALAQEHLAAGFARSTEILPEAIGAMPAEQRAHEGVSRLVLDVDRLAREAASRYLEQLDDAVVSAEHIALVNVVQDAVASRDVPRRGARPPEQPELQLGARPAERSSALIAAAVGATVGVMLIPATPVWLAVTGASVAVSSLLAAKVVRDRREEELREAHVEAVEAWLWQARNRTEGWLEDMARATHGEVRARLSELVAGAGSGAGRVTTGAVEDQLAELRAAVITATTGSDVG